MNDLLFKVGSTGPFVEAIQTKLGIGADGKFGPATLRAIQAKLGPARSTFTRGDIAALGVKIELGIDLSGHNEGGPKGLVDFRKLQGAGITFSWLKLSEGQRYENREAIRQAAECAELGIRAGGYHFGDPSGKRPNNELDLLDDAKREADHYLALRRVYFPGGPTLPDVLDLERMYQANLTAAMWSAIGGTRTRRAELCALWCLAWLDHVEQATGRRPLIYTGRWAWNAYIRAAPAALRERLLSYGQWIASYNGGVAPKRTIPGGKIRVWQQSGSGKLPGVDGKVDINFALSEALAP